MTQCCVVKDILACVASTMLLAQVGHRISESDREVQEGKRSAATLWVVPKSQETFLTHVAPLQGPVYPCQGRLQKLSVLKFSAASPQTDSINTPQPLRHRNSFQCPVQCQYCFNNLVYPPLRDSFQRQIVLVAQQREHLKTVDPGTGKQAPFMLKLSVR